MEESMEVESTTIGIKDFNVIEKYDQLDGLLKRIPSDKRGYYFYELKNIFPAEYRDRSNSNQEYDAKFLQGKMSKLKSSFKKDLVQYYPWFIVHKRFTPQRAAYLLIQWLEYLEKINSPHLKSLSSKSELAFIKRALAIRTKGEEVKVENVIKSETRIEPVIHRSYMGTSFRPIPSFPHADIVVINKILKDVEQPEIDLNSLNSLDGLFNLLFTLERICGVSEEKITGIRERVRKNVKQNTKTIFYKGLTHKERKRQLHSSLWHFRKYNRVLNQAGRLRGRLSIFFNAYITRTCSRLDKTGLVTVTFDSPEKLLGDQVDIPTVVFIALASAEFSVRKEFTLESQQQGALDSCLQFIKDRYLEKRSATQWAKIATIYPVPVIMDHVPMVELSDLLGQWIKMEIPVSMFLEDQWKKGVETCAKKGMMVPRSGTTKVDSAGWNVVSGTWNNIVRFIRAITKALGQEAPLLIKCMKLLAADQMQWAQMAGKEEQVDIRVFCNLANRGITAWKIVLGKAQCTQQDVLRACQEESVDPKRWLGNAGERRKETTNAPDMVCGVAIGNDLVFNDIVKTLGFFGYKPHFVKN